jgi:hypothetical protein
MRKCYIITLRESTHTAVMLRPSYPRSRVSSTPRVLASIAGVSEYWIVRSSRTMTVEGLVPTSNIVIASGAKQSRAARKELDCFVASLLAMTLRGRGVPPHSRDSTAPEACKFVRPKGERAQGRPGARCTRGLACKSREERRTRAYRFSGGSPAFPAQWFTAYSVLSPARPELVCHRRPRDAKHHRELDTCHWGVRTTRLRRPLQPRSSVAAFASTASHRTFVTIASRPSCRVG